MLSVAAVSAVLDQGAGDGCQADGCAGRIKEAGMRETGVWPKASSERPLHQCDADCAAMRQAYQKTGILTAAAAVGRSTAWARRRLLEHAMPLRAQGPLREAEWWDDAVTMYRSGKTLRSIGLTFGVSAEAVRYALAKRKVARRKHTISGRQHVCRQACAVILAEVQPVNVADVSRRSGVPYGQMLYVAHTHGIAIQDTHMRHICDERCAKAKQALAEGMTLHGAANVSGINATQLVQRYPGYHPDWNWKRKRYAPSAESSAGRRWRNETVEIGRAHV